MTQLAPDDLAALRRRVKTLSPAQRDRLREQLEARGIAWESIYTESEEEGVLKLTDEPRPERLELTPSQAHVWVLHQLFPKLSAYHIAFSWRLDGPLDLAALKRAWNRLVQRHVALRTVFVQDQAGRPLQSLLPVQDVELEIVDGEAGQLEESSAELLAEPFDFERGPLYRLQLQRFGETGHALVIVLHHLIADGWSRGVLMRDFVRFYRDDTDGVSDDIVQRNDYSVFLGAQEWRASEAARVQLDYWRQRLEGLTLLELPMDRNRPAEATFASQTLTRTLPRELAALTHEVARQTGATFFMVLLATFKLLLHRYTGKRDIALGVPVAGRPYPECGDLVGFFVNTLVMRTEFPEEEQATFGDWLTCVKETVLGGLANQLVPFSEVVEACAPRRSSHRNPLFEVMFQVQSESYRTQNAAAPDVDLGELKFTQSPLAPPETKFDLTWHMFDREEGLLIAVEYRSALFDRERIERMLDHFEQVLSLVVENPNRRVSDLPLGTTAERQEWLRKGAGDLVVKPVGTFADAFAEQVQQAPKATAVFHLDQACSYAELDEQAETLARQLRDAGVGPGVLIGICRRRTIDLVVALLGVMKAGGAYLPIDPTLPPARREFILKNSGCALEIGEGDNALERRAELSATLPSDTCYVLYTSGSTGRPKGVTVPHSGLMNYLRWAVDHYPYADGWGSPVQTSVGFDATITSLLAPLLCGKTVRLLPEEDALTNLAEIAQTGPSVIKLTPAHLAAIEPLLPTDLPDDKLPKALVIGGEALTAEHVRFWRRHYPQVAIYNEYGPTETVVGCCVEKIEDGLPERGNLPIGQPIAGTQLYVLDGAMNLQPTGVPGELFIAGHGVAHGYLHRPELTAERFLANPFAKDDGSHGPVLYQTGDLVSRRADGVLEYLGRADEQFQLRGYRIEPGEIEAILQQQPQVTACAVAIRSRGTSPQLVAFVQTNDDSAELDNLADALRSELPDYMIPSVYQAVEEIPLTTNGKVDRDRLPELEAVKHDGERLAPRNDREAVLLEIWQKVLGQDEIGVEDNYFEVGGDSISAMQIIAGARRKGLKLTPAMLFEHQTIAAQAGVAHEVVEAERTDTEPPSGDLPLTQLQQQFLETARHPNHFNQGILLRVKAGLDMERLAEAIGAVVQHHDAFRLRFANSDGRWRQEYGDKHQSRLLDVVELSSTESLQEELRSRQTGFNLESGPFFQATYFRLLNQDGRLLLLAHHLVVDGMSWRIFFEDLMEAYGCIRDSKPVELPARTTSFGHWVREQPDTDASESVPPLFEWGGTNSFGQAATHEVSIKTKDCSEASILSALAQTIKQFTRTPRLHIDLERHGRDTTDDTVDLSRTIGYFTKVHTVELNLPDAGLTAGLKHVQEQLSSPAERKEGAQVSFNFLGRLDLPPNEIATGLAPESIPELNSPDNPRSYLLEVIAWLVGEELKILWRYHPGLHSEQVIRGLADRHVALLESLRSGGAKEQPKSKPKLGKLMAKLASRDG